MHRNTPLLDSLRSFRSKECIEGEDKYLSFVRFHALMKHDGGYQEKMLASFRHGEETENTLQFLDLATIMAYLLEIDPSWEGQLAHSQKNYYENAMICLKAKLSYNEAQMLLKMIGRLISEDQCTQLIISTKSFSENSWAEVVRNLDVLMHKIEWESQKRALWMVENEQKLFIFLEKMFELLKRITYFKNKQVIDLRIKTMNKLLLFLLKNRNIENKLQNSENLHVWQRFIDNQKNTIIDEVTKYIKNSCQNDEKPEILSNSIKLYGIFDHQSITSFINNNLTLLDNIQFIELLKTFVLEFKEDNAINKQSSGFLLRKIYEKIFQVDKSSLSEKYAVMRGQCKLAITITETSMIDMTRKLIETKSQRQQEFQIIFLTSFLMLHLFRLTDLKKVSQSKYKFLMQGKYSDSYQAFLLSYKKDIFRAYQIYSNPQNKQFTVWELLVLRNSVLINIKQLNQKDYIPCIFNTLIGYILFDIFPEQSLEIIMIILLEDQKNDKSFTYAYKISKVMADLNEIPQMKMPSNKALACLEAILKKIMTLNKRYVNQEGPKIFEELSKMLIKMVREKRLDDPVFKMTSSMLKLCLPRNMSLDNLNKIMVPLLHVIAEDLSPKLFEVFLRLLNIGRDYPELRESLLSSAIHQIMDRGDLRRITWSQLQRYGMLTYMVKGEGFHFQLVEKCWSFLVKGILKDSYQSDFTLQAFEFFKYMLYHKRQSEELNEIITYLMKQINCACQAIRIVSYALDRNRLISEIVKMFEILKTIMLYLFELMKMYERKTNRQNAIPINNLHRQVLQTFSILQQSRWTNLFHGTQNKTDFKHIWGKCSLICLTILSQCERMSYREMRPYTYKEAETMEKSEDIRRKMEANSQNCKQGYHIILNVLIREQGRTVTGILTDW